MGWAGSTHKGKGVVHTGFWRTDLREKDHLKDSGEDRSIILK
jgi:hypothetical protein